MESTSPKVSPSKKRKLEFNDFKGPVISENDQVMVNYIQWNVYANAMMALQQHSLEVEPTRVKRQRMDLVPAPQTSSMTQITSGSGSVAGPKSGQITFRPHADHATEQGSKGELESVLSRNLRSRKRNSVDQQLSTPDENQNITEDKYNLGSPNTQDDETAGQTQIHHLFPEIMLEIFKHLDVPSRGNASKVCRRWRMYGNDRSIWKGTLPKIHLKRYNASTVSSLSKRGLTDVQVFSLKRNLKDLFNGMPHMTSLNLSGCYNLLDVTIEAALKKDVPYLKSLNLSNCKEITDKSVTMISQHCIQLQDLNLAGCSKVTNMGLLIIAWSLKNIRRLNVRSCRFISDYGVQYLTGAHDKTRNNYANELEELTLQDCHRVTDDSLRSISKGLPKLKSINLSFCPSVTDTGLKSFAGMTSLETMVLRSCDNITDIGLAYLTEHGLNVRHMDVSFCPNVTDVGLRNIALGMTKLTQLNLSNCPITDRGVLKLIENVKGLRQLLLGQCKDLSDKSIKAVIEHLNDLESIDLYGCAKVSSSLIEELSKKPKMKSLKTTL